MTTLGVGTRSVTCAKVSSATQRSRHTVRATSASPRSWPRSQHIRRPTPACRAEERSRDSTKTSETEQLKVPETPPSKESGRTADGASTSQGQSSDISDELKALQQRKREQSQASAPTGYVQGILQEVRLIEWPTPKQALLNTVLVIAIVGASSVVLFAINSILAELSKIAYR